MAKSIRSKWKRKMRAIKRLRYAVVEKKRLEKTLGIGESVEMKEETTDTLNTTENAQMDKQETPAGDGDVRMETNQVVRKQFGSLSRKKLKQRKTLKRLRLKKGQFKWTPQKH